MIRSFFQSLEDNNVDYLLISGQATVLYGAATFSEDIDIWINPLDPNRIAMLKALESLHASYYKLTPPMTNEFLNRGHGFHFSIAGVEDIYLDIMGKPPRVPDYREADCQKKVMDTDWGRLPTIGIRHLIDLKKTQRMADYSIISRLTLINLHSITKRSKNDFTWAIDNIFTLDALYELFRDFPDAVDALSDQGYISDYARQCHLNDNPDVNLENEVEDWLTKRMLVCQRNDRQYWRHIIAELKTLRTHNELMANGADVKHTA